jgi:hypothetical protein
MNIKRITFATLLLSVMCSSLVWAEYRITPTITLREEYNDNIYLERDKESDFITYVQPALILEWETKLATLTLDFGLDYEKYARNSDEDDLRPSQGSQLQSTFHLYKDVFLLDVSDNYDRVPIDDSDKGSVGNSLVNLTDRNRLIINPYLQFQPLRHTQARFDYTYENVWYQEDDGDDAETHSYITTFTQQISARISADLSGGFTQYRPKDRSSSALDDSGAEQYDRRNVNLGFLWQVNERLALSTNVGYSWLYYDFSTDYDARQYGAQADYQISSVFTAGVAYQDDISASVDEGARDQQKYSAYFAYADRSKIKLSLFTTCDDYLEINRTDDSWGGTLDGDVPITNKKGITWLLSYTDYSEGDLQDYQRYGGSIEVYHQLRLGRVSLGYTYNRNDSDIALDDYTNNIVLAKLTLTWQ